MRRRIGAPMLPRMSESTPAAARAGRGRFSPLDYRDPRPSPALIRALGPANAWALRAVLKLRTFDLPPGDLARLRAHVNADTIAFLGPNHPEFLTDWLIDKEISRRVSPLMAHWASYEIVNMNPFVQGIWLRNNLIANAPGGGGRAYSLDWSARGHGVLLHPEGTASWQADRIGPLVSGIVDMAWEAAERARARGDARPVFVVPIVWKLHFRGDVGRALAREMAGIESREGLPRGDGLSVERRFAKLQHSLLDRACERWGVPKPDAPFFVAQAQVADAMFEPLFARHGRPEGDVRRVLHALRRANRERMHEDPALGRDERRRMLEIERLLGFDPALYGGPTLGQEQIAECLKRIRTKLPPRSWREALHATVPVAAGPRDVHVRAPEPLRVEAAPGSAGAEAARAALLAELRTRLQGTLDRLVGELEPVLARHRRPNPLASA